MKNLLNKCVSVAALGTLWPCGAAFGQIVLRDQPARDGASPRWLGQTAAAPAGRRRVLVDRELRQIDIEGVVFAGSQIRYRDARGREQAIDSSSIIAVLPTRATRTGPRGIEWREIADVASGPLGRVELVDGQVIPGRLARGEPKEESILWEHALLGTLSIPVERLATLVVRSDSEMGEARAQAGRGDAARDKEPTEDLVTFTNGDVASGLVEEIVAPLAAQPPALPQEKTSDANAEADSGELRMDSGGKPFTTSLQRVASVRFANPPGRLTGVAAWLIDGTVISAKAASLDAASLVLSDGSLGGAPAVAVPWDEVVGLNLAADELTPLSALPMAEVRAGDGRHWVPPPSAMRGSDLAMGAGDIELSGPVNVRWSLPGAAARVGMTITMPPAARALGDCVVVVACGGQTIRERLNGERPSVEVRFAPSGEGSDALSVAVESGEGGSIQDRVVLERGLVLLRR